MNGVFAGVVVVWICMFFLVRQLFNSIFAKGSTQTHEQFVREIREIRTAFQFVAKQKNITVLKVLSEYLQYVEKNPIKRPKLSLQDYVFLDRSFYRVSPGARDIVLKYPDYILDDTIPETYKTIRP